MLMLRWLSGRCSRLGAFGHTLLFVLLTLVVGSLMVAQATPRKASQPGLPVPLQPVLYQIAPQQIIGIGGKIRLQGANLGTAQNAVVVFHPGVIAETVERHTPSEIVVRVPIGAQTGPIQVVTGVNAPALRTLQTQLGVLEGTDSVAVRAETAQLKTQQIFQLAFGRFSNPIQRFVTAAYMQPNPAIRPIIEESQGLKFFRNRLIVDLKDFLSFDVALAIADKIGAELVGHFPITNSYVLDLRRAPKDLKELEVIRAQVARDPRVAEVWLDMVLELKQVAFADVDVVDRYRHNYSDDLHGREDAWATDRIQAPGAWNLIERFIGRANLNEVKVAVMDSGCDQTHPEFAGVTLLKVVPVTVRVRIAGREVILPLPAFFREEAYDLGDPDRPYQHGTRVTSLIGARNGNVIGGNAQGDRGMNGLLHNPMRYRIQVYRGNDWSEGGAWATVTEFLSVINVAALTAARVMNASWGQPHPIDPNTSARRAEVRIALRKLAHQLNQFQNRLLLVVAAGNEAQYPADRNFENGHITPFEDMNLNNRLDAGEDVNGNGVLDHGNYVAASLGTLPNVITVGAIGGPNHGDGRGWARDDQRADFSNWGVPVQIAAPGVDVFAAGGFDDPLDDYDRDGDPDDPPFQIGGAWFARDDTEGTSFAAPLVAGSAALLKAIAPNLTPSQLKDYLLSTSFEVNTTDGNGDPMVWKTLKTGYAVRQLMVNRGIIGNDQPWTGVSKIVYGGSNGLGMFEIRRGDNGRAQAFAFRGVGSDGEMPAIRHDGRRVAYYQFVGGAWVLNEYEFDTNNRNALDRFPNYPGGPPEYSPANNLLWMRNLFRAGGCEGRHELLVYRANGAGHQLIALHDWHSVCPFDYTVNPPRAVDWQDRQLIRGNWRPDNRKWDLNYGYAEGTGGVVADSCLAAWWRDNDYPVAGAPLAMRSCTDLEQFLAPCWSPDGRARAGVSIVGDSFRLETRYYKANRDEVPILRNSQRVPSKHYSWPHWSPDGSELAYGELTTGFRVYSLRRDIRDVTDRAPMILAILSGRYFSWQW